MIAQWFRACPFQFVMKFCKHRSNVYLSIIFCVVLTRFYDFLFCCHSLCCLFVFFIFAFSLSFIAFVTLCFYHSLLLIFVTCCSAIVSISFHVHSVFESREVLLTITFRQPQSHRKLFIVEYQWTVRYL